jgi:hypothetical protein
MNTPARQDAPYWGSCELIMFEHWKERVVYICVTRFLFALRFSAYDSEKAAAWATVLYRLLRPENKEPDFTQPSGFLAKVVEMDISL